MSQYVPISIMVLVPYENSDGFLSNKLGALLREMADFSENIDKTMEPGNPPQTMTELASGYFAWRRGNKLLNREEISNANRQHETT